MRPRRTIQLCRSAMARRRLKNPSIVDFVVLSCAPRDFSLIFWNNTYFPWHSDRGGSQLCEREEIFNYVEALWHAVVSKIHLLSMLSCYRARRWISPPFLAQNPFPLAFGQMRVYTRRARRHIVSCCNTMTLRRLKNPFLVDFSG